MQASLQLELLLEMLQDPRVARCLSLAPMGHRSAAARSGFGVSRQVSLSVLCGNFWLKQDEHAHPYLIKDTPTFQ